MFITLNLLHIVTICSYNVFIIQDNQYIDAIKTVGSMLSHYDLEQQFPAFGFGAKFKSKGDTKACFPLTGRSGGSCVHGISVNFALGIYFCSPHKSAFEEYLMWKALHQMFIYIRDKWIV